MRIELPLEVLGLLAPILSWVEASEEVRLPGRRHRRPRGVAERQQGWLSRELPTYSRDTLDEILERARETAGTHYGAPRPPLWARAGARDAVRGLSPERDYDLMRVFLRLGDRYFEWNGYKLRVRVGHLGELHELAARFPVAHLIRHTHARAVAGAHLSHRRARLLPERLSALQTASRSLRAVVGRGLSEGHLHLWGVPSADEVWADHLLSRPATGALRRFSSPERQLLRLGRFALGSMAFGTLMAIHRDPFFEHALARSEPGNEGRQIRATASAKERSRGASRPSAYSPDSMSSIEPPTRRSRSCAPAVCAGTSTARPATSSTAAVR